MAGTAGRLRPWPSQNRPVPIDFLRQGVGLEPCRRLPLSQVADRATKPVQIVVFQVGARMGRERLWYIFHSRIVDTQMTADASIDSCQIWNHGLANLDIERSRSLDIGFTLGFGQQQ